ncbi:MAG: hypothetical protein MJZ10_11720 [Fibrobacter sp.]|nr:hypothetical protein [Fibrobacter sp.]
MMEMLSLTFTIIGTFVTCEEAIRGGIWTSIKSFFKWRKIHKKKWNSDDPVVQALLEEFKKSDKSDFTYSKLEKNAIEEIAQKYIQEKGYDKTLNIICRHFFKNAIVSILTDFADYIDLVMTEGEKVLHNDMTKGFGKIGKKIDESTSELKDAIMGNGLSPSWDNITLLLVNPKCDAVQFGTFIVKKCASFLENAVMLYPNTTAYISNKYSMLLKQCLLESNADDPYEIIIKHLSKNFEGYAKRHDGNNDFYYSSAYVHILKECGICPKSNINLDSIVNSIVVGLKQWMNWENENALSEYVDYFFDVLNDDQIVRLAEPYTEIFIDDNRRDCSPYGSKDPFKNKVIAKKIAEKIVGITTGKQNAIYPAIKHFFAPKKWSGETDPDFKKRMWSKYKEKLEVLNISEIEFSNISI